MDETEGKQKICRKMDMIREGSWSKLAADLLRDIISRLCFTDQARFHSVCMSWKVVIPNNNTRKSMLFVCVGRTNLETPTTSLESRLYDPSFSVVDKPVSTHRISFSELSIPALIWTRIRTFCKQCCLFISISESTGIPTSCIYFILFSPLTKTQTRLPSLTASCYFQQTFSSHPESADCVFLLLHSCSTTDDIITISTCRRRDTQWTVRRPMYIRGLFYIVCRNGRLASYNFIDKEIEYESLYVVNDFVRSNDTHRRYKVFTRNGELMYNFCQNGTKKFDWPNKVWIPMSSLTDPTESIVDDKPTRAEDVIEFFISESECLICYSKCSYLPAFAHKLPEYLFNSGSADQDATIPFFGIEPNQDETNPFFGIEPPLPH